MLPQDINYNQVLLLPVIANVVSLLFVFKGLINVFKVSSTWLTVNMAVGRYIAICHPLHARGYIGQQGTLIAVASIFVGSVVFNLPRFWHYQLAATPCYKLLASASSHKPIEAVQNTTASVLQPLLQQPVILWSEGQPPSSCDCSYYSKVIIRIWRMINRFLDTAPSLIVNPTTLTKPFILTSYSTGSVVCHIVI